MELLFAKTPPVLKGWRVIFSAASLSNYRWSMWDKSMKGRRASVGVIAVFHLPGLCPLFSLCLLSSFCLCLPSSLSFQRIVLHPHYFSIFPKLLSCLRNELQCTFKKNKNKKEDTCGLAVSLTQKSATIHQSTHPGTGETLKSKNSLLFTRTSMDAIIYGKIVELGTISRVRRCLEQMNLNHSSILF